MFKMNFLLRLMLRHSCLLVRFTVGLLQNICKQLQLYFRILQKARPFITRKLWDSQVGHNGSSSFPSVNSPPTPFTVTRYSSPQIQRLCTRPVFS